MAAPIVASGASMSGMAARAGMADLITQLRLMVGDTDSPQEFSDDQLQDQLDQHRLEVQRHPLVGRPSTYPGPVTEVRLWVAPWGWWEDDAAADVLLRMYDATGNLVTADDVDLKAGEWRFDADEPGPLYLDGRSYDLNAAAADVLEAWAALARATMDVTTASGEQFSRTTQVAGMEARARDYRRKARPYVHTLARADER